MFHRLEIIGKKGNIVPILLSPDMMKWLKCLMKFRDKVGVDKDNEYLFATCNYGGKGHIRGTDVLRKWSQNINAEMPELLRSIKLRKHIATVSQVANLKDNELDMLAKFMGHDIQVHRKFYRLPDETLQVARVSKLLMACNDGGHIAGKSLAEIDVAPDEGNNFKVASISYQLFG